MTAPTQSDSRMEVPMEKQGVLELTEQQELEILTGNQPDISDSHSSKLEKLGEELMGAKINTEQSTAWVRRIVPPGAETSFSNVKSQHDFNSVEAGNSVAFEFLLPSRDTFWHVWEIPESHWDSQNDLVRFLDAANVSPTPEGLSSLLGSEVPIMEADNLADREWRVALDKKWKAAKKHSDGGEEYESDSVTSTEEQIKTYDKYLYGFFGGIGITAIILPILISLGEIAMMNGGAIVSFTFSLTGFVILFLLHSYRVTD